MAPGRQQGARLSPLNPCPSLGLDSLRCGGVNFQAPCLMHIHSSTPRAVFQRKSKCSCMSPAPQHRREAPHLIGRTSIAKTESGGCRNCCLSTKQIDARVYREGSGVRGGAGGAPGVLQTTRRGMGRGCLSYPTAKLRVSFSSDWEPERALEAGTKVAGRTCLSNQPVPLSGS